MPENVLARIGRKPLLNGGGRVYIDTQGTWMEYTHGLGVGKVWKNDSYQPIKDTELLVYRWLVEKNTPLWVNREELYKFAGRTFSVVNVESTWTEVAEWYETIGRFYGFSQLDLYPNLFKLEEVKREWLW